MNDGTMSVGKLIAVGLWVWVVVLSVMGWALFFWGLGEEVPTPVAQRLSYALLLTAGVLSPAAAVFHIRCYFVKLGNLVTATALLGNGEPARVRTFPRQPVR